MLMPPVVNVRLGRTESSWQDARADRHALAFLDRLPPKSRVVVNVGNRTTYTTDAVSLLRRHMNRLVIQLEGVEEAPGAWYVEITGASQEAAP